MIFETIFGWMHLIAFQIIGIITGTIALVSIILMVAYKFKLSKSIQTETTENDELIAVKVSSKDKSNTMKQISKWYFIAFICIIISLTSIVIYSYYNTIALKYGAYENIQKAQTLDKIRECEKVGYTESPEIPDNLQGCILIYFKYGCPDCSQIHNDLMRYLENNKDKVHNVYFVSSRSPKGKALLKQYPVDEVPSGVYIRKHESDVSNMYVEILYKKEKKDDEKSRSIFYKDGMDFLVEQQIKGE